MTRSKNANDASVRIKSERSLLPSEQVISDEILVARVIQGDSTALEALYDRHAAVVLGVLLKVIGDRALAEDVLQETFWRVWKSASTYEPERGSFTGWLFRIARNLAIDAHRRSNVRPPALGNPGDEDAIADRVPDPDTDVAEQAQADFRNRQVRTALA